MNFNLNHSNTNVKSDHITGIDNIAHESLINGYLRELNEEDIITPYSIINLCFMYYFDQISWDKVDIFIKQKIDFMTDLLDVTDNKALELLLKNKWDKSLASDDYFSGVANQDEFSKLQKHQQIQPDIATKCESCTEFNDDIFSLECGHKIMCKNCWIYYLQINVTNNKCLLLTCPKKDCNIVIPRVIWKQFLFKQYKLDYQRYIRFLREHCIQFNKESFTNCGNKECQMIYFSLHNVERNVGVECRLCEYEFCWGCKDIIHFPLTCDDAKQWLIKCELRKSSVSLMKAKRDLCPKCDKGPRIKLKTAQYFWSNFQKCKSCNHCFCRLCMMACGAKQFHYHKCYSYSPNDTKLFKDRFEFEYHRFNSNLRSAEYALTKQTSHIRLMIHDLTKIYSWSYKDTIFLHDAKNALVQCLYLLAWASPTLYYIGDSTEYDLYKLQLAQLQQFCNNLNDKLDISVDNILDMKTRNIIITFTRTVNKHRRDMCRYMNTELSVEFLNEPDENDEIVEDMVVVENEQTEEIEEQHEEPSAPYEQQNEEVIVYPNINQDDEDEWIQRAIQASLEIAHNKGENEKDVHYVLENEPDVTDSNATEIRIRFPTGITLQRIFKKHSKIMQLYIFCEQHLDDLNMKISLSQAMPRMKLDDKKNKTFQELGLLRTTIICHYQ
eukprot:148998_1